MNVDALVVGAGPAGATAAQRLAAHGWSVALAEKSVFPRRKVCGEFISAPTLALLDALGAGAGFLAESGPPVRRVAIFAGDASASAELPQDGRHGRALGRERLDILLRDAAVAAGAILLQPAEVIAIRRLPRRMVCQVRQTNIVTELAARRVIVACGSWNNTGAFALPGPRRGESDLLAFKGHFQSASLAEDLIALLAFPGGYGGLVNSDAGRLSFSCCIRRRILKQVRRPGERAADAVLRHIQETTLGLRDALRRSTNAGPILSVGPIRPGRRAVFRDGLFFAGNMAGEAHPIIADGISMAIQSSWLLARLLVEGRLDTDLGDLAERYARAWRLAFAMRIAVSTVFAGLAMNRITRCTAKQLILAFPGLLTIGARASGKAGLPNWL